MRVSNRKFSREYQKLEEFETGIALIGAEVKSIRAGNIRLEESFAKIIGSEAFLINADVPVYPFSRPQGYDSKRTRKLLLHKKELLRLKVKIAGSPGLTIVPVACYNKGSLIKLQIALVKGRKETEKKKLDKAKDVKRQQEREIKEHMKI
jgi:SsrA-binding protein